MVMVLVRAFFGGISMKPMTKLSDYFVPYESAENLFNKVQKLAYLGNHTEIQYKIFRENIERKVWPLLRQTKFYIIEDNYIETEWKDMIAEHYIHTKYNVVPTVVRVHLFNDEQKLNDSYLGCFTIRKIDNNDMSLSFIYPNWNVLRMEECNFANCYLVTAKKRIHIYAEELEIKTTPYFAQDGTVTCCAHASILMMSHFLNLRFGYKKIRISEMAQGYLRREKKYPTKGLVPEQIMEILTNNGVYIRPNNLDKREQYEEKAEDIKNTIKAHLRSGLPVLLGINKHAVLIIGFCEDEEHDGILFLDDSGVLIHNINEAKYINYEQEYDNFISRCSWEYILNFVKNTHGEVVRFLIPFHEKVFVSYDDVFSRCLIIEKNIDFGELEGEETYTLQNKRFFIADNVECKRFINENVLDREFSSAAVDEFIRNSLPHYLWCYEFEFEGEIYILFINSTYNVDTKVNDVYINRDREPFHIEKHFHTTDSIRCDKVDEKEIPLFTNRVQRKGGLIDSYKSHEEEIVETKVPKEPAKRLEEPLIKIPESNPLQKEKEEEAEKEKE